VRSGPRKYGAGLCTAALLVAAATQCTFSLPALVADQDAEPDGAAEGGPDAPLDAPDASRDATLDAAVDSAPDATVDAPTDAAPDAPIGCPTAGSIVLVKGGLSQPTSVKVDSTYVYWSALDGTLALLPRDGGSPCDLLPGASPVAIHDIAIDPVRIFYVWGNPSNPPNGIQAATVGGSCSGASTPDYFHGQRENGPPHSVALPYAPGVAATSAFFAQTNGVVAGCLVLPDYSGDDAGLCFTIESDGGLLIRTPYRIAADSDHIYWTNNGGGSVMSALQDGGAITVIATEAGAPMGIAVDPADGGYVYWGDQAGNIMRANKDGTNATQVASSAPAAESLTLDSKYVYWVASGDGGPASGAVLRAPLAGGCTTTLAAAQDNPWNLAVDPADGGSVYWVNNVDDGGIYQVVNPP